MTVYIKNQQKLIRINLRRTTKLLLKCLNLLGLNGAELSVLFVNDARMRLLNSQYRGMDKTTDVLSFPQYKFKTKNSRLKTPNVVLGDIVVNLHKAKRQAAELGCSLNDELKRLLIHGLLHLLGYDHEKGARYEREMKKKEEELFMKIE